MPLLAPSLFKSVSRQILKPDQGVAVIAVFDLAALSCKPSAAQRASFSAIRET